MNLKFILIKPEELPEVLDFFKAAAKKIAQKNIDHWQYWKNPPPEKVSWVKKGIANNEFFFIEDQAENRIGMVRILKEDLLYWGEQEENANYVHSFTSGHLKPFDCQLLTYWFFVVFVIMISKYLFYRCFVQ